MQDKTITSNIKHHYHTLICSPPSFDIPSCKHTPWQQTGDLDTPTTCSADAGGSHASPSASERSYDPTFKGYCNTHIASNTTLIAQCNEPINTEAIKQYVKHPLHNAVHPLHNVMHLLHNVMYLLHYLLHLTMPTYTSHLWSFIAYCCPSLSATMYISAGNKQKRDSVDVVWSHDWIT